MNEVTRSVIKVTVIAMLLTGCGSNVLTGRPGADGTPGKNGHSAAFSQGSADTSLCPAGGYVLSAGADLNDDGLLSTAEAQTVAVACNGQNGAKGADGKDVALPGFVPVGIVNPCGDAPGVYDEVFLRLANGMLLASFSDNANGQNTRFSVLTPGNYVTSDGDYCYFTVDASGSITNESHHN